jgi:hypothetical protein
MSNTQTIIEVNTLYDNIPGENEIVQMEKENEEEFKYIPNDDIYCILEDRHERYFLDETITDKLNEVYFAYNIGYKKDSIEYLVSCFKYITERFGLDYEYISLKTKDNIYISHNKKDVNIPDKFDDNTIDEININNIYNNNDPDDEKTVKCLKCNSYIPIIIEDSLCCYCGSKDKYWTDDNDIDINEDIKHIPEKTKIKNKNLENSEIKETINSVKLHIKEAIPEKNEEIKIIPENINKKSGPIKNKIDINIDNIYKEIKKYINYEYKTNEDIEDNILKKINEFHINRTNKYNLMIELYNELIAKGIDDSKKLSKYIKTNKNIDFINIFNDTKYRRLYNKCERLYKIKDYINIKNLCISKMVDKIFNLKKDQFNNLIMKLK